ncbi:MAG TPA: hypothetical protein VK399_11805 [Longimicrobiaceae bacterium]|nr:hypothetical protein [Longimicrobiaceae bacterium]
MSASYAANHRRARDFWRAQFSGALPWNQITAARFGAALERAEAASGPGAA